MRSLLLALCLSGCATAQAVSQPSKCSSWPIGVDVAGALGAYAAGYAADTDQAATNFALASLALATSATFNYARCAKGGTL